MGVVNRFFNNLMDKSQKFTGGSEISNQFFFNMFRLAWIIICIACCFAHQGKAQTKRFGTGIFAGLGLSQIDGDDMQGYDKPGIHFGLRGIAYILPKFEFHTELSYSQRGSQSKGYKATNNQGRRLELDYGSITALAVANDWFHPLKEYFRLQFYGGVSLGRLIRIQAIDPSISDNRRTNFNELIPYYNTTDFSMVIGANIKTTRFSGLTFRYNRSMNKIIDAELVQPFFQKRSILSMKGYYISLGAFYLF